MREAVIVSAVRTAIARRGGALKDWEPHIYGAEVVKEAIRRARVDPEEIDDVIFGNALAGGGNVARLTALQAGLSLEVPGVTIDRQCGSGMNAVALAALAVQGGAGEIFVAGGTESMTRAPYLLEPPSKPFDRNPPRFVRRLLSPEHIGNPPMGITAENLAEKYRITREEQDRYALVSQRRMARAMEKGLFREQIVPLTIPGKQGELLLFDTDEHPRPETSLEVLSRLPPAFKEGGTVTAGNSSGVNDGAAALVVMSRRMAESRGLTPLATVRGFAVAGVDPNLMGIGPVPATKKLLKREGLALEDIDLIELNEAFAAQVLACARELPLDMEKVNVNGGAIAHGHPIAATGAILVTKLVYEMNRRNARRGLVTACIGGGQGIAVLLER
ncbi:acetyl-CoA C-acetyltransferase [Planifilum fimeticola]|jgi:acetyl-CoA C-acetyltransferase|uniref:acetyl-CoA C-acyltransferase n=1 Tax=Planifilum fimeticola TaxID=201975 RepID=A0A2T0LGB5_9BACL|nr:thiolase family protein [Planifilum fimeticola]PRX41318.1 acetyl-CoA C-acetyltransferase [Planifilum fimeticola]